MPIGSQFHRMYICHCPSGMLVMGVPKACTFVVLASRLCKSVRQGDLAVARVVLGSLGYLLEDLVVMLLLL